ncbi:MAG: isocitrate lyase/phosphoenolpyruvate mutase family protein [Pseudomonadota bacterium]
MDWTERRTRFRALLNGSQCVYPGSVFDPISARIAEDVGFEIGMFAGSVASMTVLGAPDLIVLTLSEFADQAYRICRAGNLALLVDADHGYGNALNVKRTVEELETAGVSAMSVEDTDLPQPFATLGQPSLISIDEGVGKMRAAIEGRQDPKFVIAGRTSAIRITGLDDTIKRCQAYEGAGVDALFLVGIRERAELEAVSRAVTLPFILGGVPADMMDRDYLAGQRVRVCLQGHMPFSAAVQAVYTTLKALRDGADPKSLPNLASGELMKQMTREGNYDDWMNRFLQD